MNELVTVIIPAYNAEQYINRCIKSLLSQEYENIEILVVDDGSKDATLSLCNKLCEKDQRVKVIHQDNSGVSVARNKGLELANGRYVTFVDADDYVNSDFITSLVSNLKDNNAQLSICGFVEKKGEEVLGVTEGTLQVMDQEKAIEAILKADCFRGFVWNKLFCVEIIRENKLRFHPEIAIWEDVLFAVQYMLKIQKIVYDPRPLYNYIYLESSASHGGNHVMSVEKSYTAIQAKDIMKNDISMEYKDVWKQLSYRYVQSSLAVIRNIGYSKQVGKYKNYLSICRNIIKKNKKEAKPFMNKKERVLTVLCEFFPGLLMFLYRKNDT